MTPGRAWWIGAVVLDLVLWAALLAIPAIILVLPNQWQGDSLTAPIEIVWRAALSQAAGPVMTAALGLLVVLAVAAAQHRRRRPAAPDGQDAPDGRSEAELVDR
ncbi:MULTISPECIES: hypothetical protein [unclassified Rathayibacter]|uniref:hypothetical protein n=1 Tax=unclassified Rathayibacter TaxID=2609250 RepID=UPI001FB302DA|nr:MULTISPECIES: hypothetical protein [unclassified Rathayibacter]MCJ1671833.1 hypothetical protein [Rathayibacter sp. VKM Ac-2929]MCJ1683988.1 hypothetical protein [Rathayibacter sp. VKM Ac-2928]